MAPRTDSGWLRRRIGRELRTLRDAAPDRLGRKITTSDAAQELGCTQPKITSIELGKHRLQWRDVRDLLLFYEASENETNRLVSWAKRSSEPIWWEPFAEVVEDWFADLVGGEGEAEREVTYEHGLIPGLLQTKEYATAMTAASRTVSDDQRDLVVALRLERQYRLVEEEPLELVAVIEESVMHRPVGSSSVMAGQLEYLLDAGDQDNITVQILPTAVGPHVAINGAFILLEFAEFGPALYLQHQPAFGGRYSDDPNLTTTYEKIASEIQDLALTPKASAKRIRARLKELM